ncbi:hypothetical protein PAMA_008902 [Pampus argenteus]
MSNNNASNNLIIAQRAVKQLRLEASIRRIKSTRLQLRCNQQDAELRRREQHSNRLKERLSQLTDRHKEKGPCHTGVGTDHDKLLAQLETELKASQQLVKLQQQLLQDSLMSPAPSELADSYFLEEWERLQVRWAELDHQRRTFERERQSFTDAAIRLSHDVRRK